MYENKEIKRNVYLFLYSEKIKTGLMLIANVINQMINLEVKDDSIHILKIFINSLRNEVNIAYNVTGNPYFKEIEILLNTFTGKIKSDNIIENLQYLSKAISVVTTCAAEAADILINKYII